MCPNLKRICRQSVGNPAFSIVCARENRMYVGILTGPFSKEPLEVVAAFAGQYSFGGLEIVAGPGSKHIDTDNFTPARAQEVRDLMDKRALQISAVAAYTNVTDADPDRRARNIKTVHDA